jgi:2-hydroxy-4-carboxymuconate semialdehyde hemiacetal dehydrogenase
MNVVIIGYGAIAHEHALALRRIGQAPDTRRVSLVGVMGRLLEPTRALAEEFGATVATTELGELLADPRVEAIIVCSPTDLHAEQTDRLIDLAERLGLLLMVCHTQRFAAPLIEAWRMIASGELLPLAMVSRYLLNKRENASWTGRRRSWTDNLLRHHGCHAVDVALWLLGTESIDVTARATPPDPRLTIPMDLSIQLRTAREHVVT